MTRTTLHIHNQNKFTYSLRTIHRILLWHQERCIDLKRKPLLAHTNCLLRRSVSF